MFTSREKIVLTTAIFAAGMCFALAASFLNDFNAAYAQTTTGSETTLGQINATIMGISLLISTAIGIVSGAIAWLRAKTGDTVISNDTNDWLQDLFEKIRKKDDDVRDIFRQVLEKHAEIDVVLDVVKGSNPALAKQIDEAKPKVETSLKEINTKIAHWQAEADKLYSVSPKADPVRG